MRCVYGWWHKTDNFGDAFNPYALEFATGRRPVNAYLSVPSEGIPILLAVGSTLQNTTLRTRVCGAGLISSTASLKAVPERVYSVRGPMTRRKLLEMGIDCPKLYGDPGLSIGMVFGIKKSDKPKYKIGIVPHYVDRGLVWLRNSSPDVLVMDAFDAPSKVASEIADCECVASSSLHGIITADALGVPSVWIDLTGRVIGEGFKFRDYASSVGGVLIDPIYPRVRNMRHADLIPLAKERSVDVAGMVEQWLSVVSSALQQ